MIGQFTRIVGRMYRYICYFAIGTRLLQELIIQYKLSQ